MVKYCNTWVILFFAVIGTLSFVVGLITFIFGCDPKYPDSCFLYDIVTGTAYGYEYETSLCTSNNDNDNTQTVWTCYDSFVKFHISGTNNKSCNYQTCDDDTSQSRCNRQAQKYPIGTERTLMYYKSESDTCSLVTTLPLTLWIVGLTFLSCFICSCGICSFQLYYNHINSPEYLARMKQRNKPPPVVYEGVGIVDDFGVPAVDKI